MQGIFEMALIAKDDLELFRRAVAPEMRQHERILKVMRQHGIHALRTEFPVGAEDSTRSLGYDSPGPQGAGLGHSSGLSQAFAAHNHAARDLYGTPNQEQGPGPHTPMTTSVQEGTSAIGGPRGPVEEGIDTNLHGGYRRYWNHHARDNLKYAEGCTKDEYVNEEGTSSTESGVSPGNVGEKLKNPPGVGLHSEAVDSYGELAGGLFEIDPAACAALEAILTAQGFSPADAKRVVMQHLIAPMQKANFDRGTGAPAQDAPNPVPGQNMPVPGRGPVAGDHSLNARNAALLASDRVGLAFSSDARPVQPRRRLHEIPHSEVLSHIAQRLDLPNAARRMALDHLKAARANEIPSEVFRSSGAARVGWAA
jgi:hypothetical protein